MPVLKPWHIAVLVIVLIALFGYKRLPDAARAIGRSLRIMKAETRGLVNDDVQGKADAQHGRTPLATPEDRPSPPPIVDPVERRDR